MIEAAIESTAIGVRRVRAARILSLLGFVGLFAAVGSAVLMMERMRDGSPVLLLSTYLFWLVPWVASYVIWFLEPKKRGRIVIGPDGGLSIERGGATRVLPPAAVESAQSVVRADGPRVEVVLTTGDVFTIGVPSIADADAIVDRVGFGPGGRRQRIDLGARKRRFLHLALGFLAYQATALAAVPLLVIAMLSPLMFAFPFVMGGIVIALPFVYRFLRKKAAAPRLEIGDDGLALTLGTRPPRFFARKDIYGAQVVPGSANIALSTAEGTVMVSGISLDDAVLRAALHAAERRWSATAAALGARIATFERSGRPLETWRAELAAKISAAGYRGNGITIEEADAVLRNAGASTDARIGAALALAAAGERVRIAGVAAPIADQRLRVALEAVAEDREEPALLEAATAERKMLRG